MATETAVNMPTSTPLGGFVDNCFDFSLSKDDMATWMKIRAGLTATGATLNDGSAIEGNGHAVKWLIEQVRNGGG